MKKLFKTPTLWLGLSVVLGGAALSSTLSQDSLKSFTDAAPAIVRTISTPAASAPNVAALESLDQTFADLVDFASPSVVHIRAQVPVANRREAMMNGQPLGGQGSGVIFRQDGYIITNDHVVGGFDEVTVILNDGREFKGKVTRGNDRMNDIAVVKIDPKGEKLPVARFGDSNEVRPGQHAIAIGAPFGLENTVTIGHISGLARTNSVMSEDGGRGYSGMIQTDAPINPGNSGGPLFNIDGEVVGINTTIFSGTGGNVGIGFSIPSNQARLVAEMLIEDGKLTRGYLGLMPEDMKPFELKKFGLKGGAIIREVPNDGPAAAAGMKPNDIVVRVGDMVVTNQLDLRNAMLKNRPGQSVDVEIVRDGQRQVKAVRVADMPQPMAMMQPGPGDMPDMGPNSPFRRFFDGPMDPRQLPGTPDGMTPPSAPTPNGGPRLGVSVEALTPRLIEQYKLPAGTKGAAVNSVQPGSPAARLGLRPGDVVTSVNGEAIDGPEALVAAVRESASRRTLSIEFLRMENGQRIVNRAEVTLR